VNSPALSGLGGGAFPGLLFFLPFGLPRLEGVVQAARPGGAGISACVEPTARAIAGSTPVRHAPAEAAGPTPASRFDPMLLIDEPGLPTRPNPLFQPSAAANRV
ncbi:MAG: hypothetical protein ACKOQ4_00005, partial [Mycobacterium sp.]